MTLDREVGVALVARAQTELRDADAVSILKWADDAVDGRLVVATSMQDAVVVDLATKVRPDVDVLFLDTGYHFAETLGMRDAVASSYRLRLLTVTPSQTVDQQDASYGPQLHDRDPDLCCYLRKVKPLNAMLGLYDGWVSGLRRAEGASRADVQPVEWDERRQLLKVNPIYAWSDDEVDAYIRDNNVLINPLRSEGYGSIGCAPCTARVTDPNDPRSGRWPGMGKSECGIHE